MWNKLSVLIIVALTTAVAYLGFTVNRLQKNIEELKKAESANIEIVPEKPATPEVSPFDKNNNDPTLQLPADSKPAEASTSIKFNNLTHDFGRIQQGSKASTEFTFTNTGTNPLVISNARGSCGCTVPTWPHQAIEPGGTGKIFVVFDSYGKSGEQSKTVTVVANTSPSTTTLTVKSTVIPQDN